MDGKMPYYLNTTRDETPSNKILNKYRFQLTDLIKNPKIIQNIEDLKLSDEILLLAAFNVKSIEKSPIFRVYSKIGDSRSFNKMLTLLEMERIQEIIKNYTLLTILNAGLSE